MTRDYTKFAKKTGIEVILPPPGVDPRIFTAIDPRRDNPPDPNNLDSPLWDKLLSLTFHAEMRDPASELPLSWALYELRWRGSVLRYIQFQEGTEGYKLYPVVGRPGNWPSQTEYGARAKELLSPHGELLLQVLGRLKEEKPPDL